MATALPSANGGPGVGVTGGYAPGGIAPGSPTPWNGGNAPGGIPNPATTPAPVLYTGGQPVLYPAPVTPNQPGTSTGSGAPPAPVAPPIPVDCGGCGDATPAGPGAVTPISGPTTQPVLKAATSETPCEVCTWLRSRPWWVWLLVLLALYLLTRRER